MVAVKLQRIQDSNGLIAGSTSYRYQCNFRRCSVRNALSTRKIIKPPTTPCVRRSIRYCRESAVVLRPPLTHLLDGVIDALRRLGRFVAGQGEDEEHGRGQVAQKFGAGSRRYHRQVSGKAGIGTTPIQ